MAIAAVHYVNTTTAFGAGLAIGVSGRTCGSWWVKPAAGDPGAMVAAPGVQRGHLEMRYCPAAPPLLTKLTSKAALTKGVTFVGHKLSVPAYCAALFALGFRIFQNLGARRLLRDGRGGASLAFGVMGNWHGVRPSVRAAAS